MDDIFISFMMTDRTTPQTKSGMKR